MDKRRQRLLALVVIVIIIWCMVFHKPYVETMDDNTMQKKIDVIYYINLDKRTDRKEQFLQEMAKIGFPEDKIVRIDAVPMPGKGDLGCSKSHVKTMETFIQSGLTNCIVFEDDFEFVQSPEQVRSAFSYFFNYDIPYDVCMVSANEVYTDESDYSLLRRVINVQTASGYMVNQRFAPTLLANFKEGTQQLEDGYAKGDPNAGTYAVDQYWKRLQPDSEWYMFYPKLGKQRSSMSDIQGGYVEMNV